MPENEQPREQLRAEVAALRAQIHALQEAVTEHEHVEETLRQAQERFVTIFQMSPCAMSITTLAEGCYVDVNESFLRLVGYSREEVIGHTSMELQLWVDPEEGDRLVQTLLTEPTAHDREITLRTKTGEVREVLAAKEIIELGGERCVLAMLRDITDRKRMEVALQASEERYRSLFDYSIDAVLLMTPEGAILAANPAACQLFGRTEAELCQLGRDAVFDTTDIRFSKLLEERTRSGKFRGELTLIRNDGSQFPAEISCAVFTDRNGVRKTCTIIRDMTERKRAEEALRESEKLAATGRMAARIAHEINNPLAAIMNSFLLLKDAIPPDYPHYEFVGLIQKEIDRIARIVRQMYGLYRPEQEAAHEFSVEAVMNEVIALLQALCRAHAVTIKVEREGFPSPAFLPESSLRQVLFNLLVNAIEASPRGGIVAVTTTFRVDSVCIAVADQGQGIPETVGNQIFEPFFSTKESWLGSGVGLGLSISKSLVEAMGGTIAFHSTPGHGTVFRIILPLRQHPGREGRVA